MDLHRLEIELKKRLIYPYRWGRKQSDSWDRETNFIYVTNSFQELLKKTRSLDANIRDYALNRWYNYWSAMGAEYIFSTHPQVSPNKNIYDKLVDFTIEDIPFDHKTTVFPGGFPHSVHYALEHKQELIEWLYLNQSQQGRKHLKNRLFIVLHDPSGRHWKLKSEIQLIKAAIDFYLKNFSSKNLLEIVIDKNEIQADIIWILK
ncbi:hypothetical protein [Salegentibacter sediminis]|uniref:hypothetical protein n=1 Tax=Salegentibacter sediminis TaxID=1930251 RepID=UPI0009BD2668|nr:hypothetical protein [Salegentibacter sediminis]